jgi:1-phosphofructokinase
VASSKEQAGVAVFAPAPELTVTLECLGGRDEMHLHAGGQGFWIARLLSVLGVPTSLSGSFGGETGAVVRGLIEREGIDVVAVDVAGENGGYVHDRRSGERDEVGVQLTMPLTRHEIDDLYAATLVVGLAAGICVLGGTNPDAPAVPAEVYRRLATDLRSNGAIVVADLSGEPMHEALEGGLDVLKTSDEDMKADGLLSDEDDEAAEGELVEAMGELSKRGGGARHVIVTRAHRPALAMTEGQVLSVRGPQLEPVDTRGAGDSVTAGVTAALSRGDSFEAALRLGVAAGTLNVARHGLASGHPGAIAEIVERVVVEPFEPFPVNENVG